MAFVISRPARRTRRRGPHRLINARTLALEDFRYSAPPYAILSHTWALQEATLQDWRAALKTDTAGYGKVVRTCHRALHDGIDYIWVDTCCIDRTNNVELSEAINSMFKWYQDAEVCYVLLSDLELSPAKPGDKAAKADEKHTLSSEESHRLARCRYFTRGWPLQEMLAAKIVQFFAADWTRLGDLRRLAQVISQITRIDSSLLRGTTSLGDYSIPQKISWAAGRTTTRLEDRAYSLLGLLGVHMHTQYGAGEQAFELLQKEVLKLPQGMEVLAWDRSDVTRSGSLLARSPDDFAHCSSIAADKRTPIGAEVWETNVGLRGSFPIYHRPSSARKPAQDLLVLDCYETGVSSRRLALRVTLCSTRNESLTFSIASIERTDATDQTLPFLDRVASEEYKSVRRRTATISWHDTSRRVTARVPESHHAPVKVSTAHPDPGHLASEASRSDPRVTGPEQWSSLWQHYVESRKDAESPPAQSNAGPGSSKTVSTSAPISAGPASSSQSAKGPMTLKEFRETYRGLTEYAQRHGLTKPRVLTEREERYLAENLEARVRVFEQARRLWRRESNGDSEEDSD